MLSLDLPKSITHGSDHYTLRFVIPRIWTQPNGRTFGIYWSDQTSHGVLFPEPSDAELTTAYDIPSYDNYLSGTEGSTEIAATLANRILVKIAYLADRSAVDPVNSITELSHHAPSVCDLGCGSGEFLGQMRSRGANVVGVDPSPVSERALKGREIEFHAGTAESLPTSLQGRTFDVVTMFQSLEHCRRPDIAVANARALLSPRGLFVVDVPNMDCLGFQTYRQAWFHTDAGRHLQFFTPKSLANLCRSAGLQPIVTEYSGFTGQFTPRWIADMAQVWDSLFSENSDRAPPRPSLGRSLAYLLPALFAPKRRKYDVVRVFARAC